MSSKGQFQSGDATPLEKRSFGTDRFGFRVAIVLAVLILIVTATWPMQASAFNQEGGPLETISAAALLVAGVVALFKFSGLSRLYIGLVCLLLAERELEADVYSVESLPYSILHGLDVMLDMTIVRVVLAVLILGGVLWHGVPNAWRALKARAPFLLIFFIAGMSAFVAQVLEEISSAFGEEMTVVMATRLFVVEETLEMFFSIGILAAVLIGWPKSGSEENKNDQPAKPDAR